MAYTNPDASATILTKREAFAMAALSGLCCEGAF
jgi:hypothetical protein